MLECDCQEVHFWACAVGMFFWPRRHQGLVWYLSINPEKHFNEKVYFIAVSSFLTILAFTQPFLFSVIRPSIHRYSNLVN